MNNFRIVPKIEVKQFNLVKGYKLEGLRVLGNPLSFMLSSARPSVSTGMKLSRRMNSPRRRPKQEELSLKHLLILHLGNQKVKETEASHGGRKMEKAKMEKAKAKEAMKDGVTGMEALLVGIQILMQEEHLKQEEAEDYPTLMLRLRMIPDVHGHALYVDLLTP